MPSRERSYEPADSLAGPLSSTADLLDVSVFRFLHLSPYSLLSFMGYIFKNTYESSRSRASKHLTRSGPKAVRSGTSISHTSAPHVSNLS